MAGVFRFPVQKYGPKYCGLVPYVLNKYKVVDWVLYHRLTSCSFELHVWINFSEIPDVPIECNLTNIAYFTYEGVHTQWTFHSPHS